LKKSPSPGQPRTFAVIEGHGKEYGQASKSAMGQPRTFEDSRCQCVSEIEEALAAIRRGAPQQAAAILQRLL
jgi:hypothetical protein